MAMVYDLPQVEANIQPMQQFTAPETRNVAAEQAGQMGQAVSRMGEAAVKIEDMRATAAATQSDNELVTHLQDLSMKYNQLHGEEAVKARDAFLRLAQNKADEIKARSSSPIERGMVDRVFAQRIQSFNGHIDTSYVGQLDKWEKSEAAGRVTLAGQGLYNQWASYGTPAFTKAKDELDSRIKEAAQREGLGPEATEAYRIKELTGQHKQILGAMISNNQAEMAKEYLKTHINEIETDDRTKLQDLVKRAGADQKGTNDAMEAKARFLKGEKFDVIVEDYFKKYGGGTDKLDTEAFKVFRAQFTADRSDVERAWHDESLLLAMPVNKAILERQATLGRQLTPKELNAIPEYTQMRMSSNPMAVKEANRLSDEVTREYNTERRINRQLNAAAASAAKQAKADQITAQSSLTLAGYTANPQLLAGLTDAQKAAVEVSLDKAHRGQWKTLVENTTSQKAITTLALTQQQFDNFFKEMGWTDKTKVAAARNAATTYLLNEQKEKGYHFDKATAMKALSAGVAEVEVKSQGGWNPFSSTMKMPLMNVKYKGNIIIPKEDRELIESELKKNGIANPTTDDVADAYTGLLAERKRGK